MRAAIIFICGGGKVEDGSGYFFENQRTVTKTLRNKDHAAFGYPVGLVFNPEFDLAAQVRRVFRIGAEKSNSLSKIMGVALVDNDNFVRLRPEPRAVHIRGALENAAVQTIDARAQSIGFRVQVRNDVFSEFCLGHFPFLHARCCASPR